MSSHKQGVSLCSTMVSVAQGSSETLPKWMAGWLSPPVTKQIPGHTGRPNLRTVHLGKWLAEEALSPAGGMELWKLRLGAFNVSCPRSLAGGSSIRICTRFKAHKGDTLLCRDVRSVEKGHRSLLAREIASLGSNRSGPQAILSHSPWGSGHPCRPCFPHIHPTSLPKSPPPVRDIGSVLGQTGR